MQFLGHPGHRSSRPGHPILPAGYPDEKVYVPWVPHTAHKLLTPGHRSGGPWPPGRETPPTRAVTRKICLCLCAFSFPELGQTRVCRASTQNPLCKIRRKPGFVPGFHRICPRDKPGNPRAKPGVVPRPTGQKSLCLCAFFLPELSTHWDILFGNMFRHAHVAPEPPSTF